MTPGLCSGTIDIPGAKETSRDERAMSMEQGVKGAEVRDRRSEVRCQAAALFVS